ncbi:MAG: hypothetical protein EOM19_01500 [Candidatus Moranbacteria bacterium]|nr:hypothetical protein [Candidatus Moranbacteria bacterium]
MAVARVDNPWVRNLTLAPSRVYASSPYRPYAGVFSSNVNVSTQQYEDAFIRALSPFSINDQNVIDAIRRNYNISNNGSYDTAKMIGGIAGAGAGIGLSALLYGKSIAMLSSQIAYSGAVASAGTAMTAVGTKVGAASALTANPIGLIVSAAALTLAVAGIIMTSIELGKVGGASVGSKEGRIAMGKYLANLGNSLVKRPTSTVLTTATIVATNFAFNKIGVRSPIVRQGATMAAMRVVRPIASSLDDQLFGALNETEQMSYTDLLSLQGDLADNFSGTSLVKAGLAGITGGADKSKELIAKMYGKHEEGFDPLDFSDVRETWGVDIGTFGNGIVDILGEIVFDTDNVANTVKNKRTTAMSKSFSNQVIKKILSNENSDLFKRYFEKVEGKIQAKDAFKNEFANKKLQRYIENFLDDYKDPSIAKTKKERDAIIKENNLKLDHHLGDLHMYLVDKGLPNIKDQIERRKEAIKIIEEIKKEIMDSFESNSAYIGKSTSDRTKYARAVRKITEAQKEADQIVNQAFRDNAYNFDKSLLKEFEINKFDPGKEYTVALLKQHPIFRMYSASNDNVMRILGYFTRPFQSIVSSKRGKKLIRESLNKYIRKFDPYKKVTNINDILDSNERPEGTDKPQTKEEYKAEKKKIEEITKKTRSEIRKMEQKKIRRFLGDEEINRIIDELNALEERMDTYKLTAEEDAEYNAMVERREEILEIYRKAKKNAIKKMKKEDLKSYNLYMSMLRKINERYRVLKAQTALIDAYLSIGKFTYNENGKFEKREITKDNEQEIQDKIKELHSMKYLTGEQRKNLEEMQKAFFVYARKEIFEDGYKVISADYNKVIGMMQDHETWFAENVYNLYSLILNTTTYKDVVSLRKQIENGKKELAEKTEDQHLKEELEKMKEQFGHKVELVVRDLKKAEIFDEKTRKEIIKALGADGEISLPIYYATNFFSGIKLFEQDHSFFLNNRELFDEINSFITKNTEVQRLLDDLQEALVKTGKKGEWYRFVGGTKAIEDKKQLTDIIRNMLINASMKTDSNGSPLLSAEHLELLKDKIEGVVASLINTHKMMEQDQPTQIRKNSYTKKFSEMSQNDVIDYAFRLAMKNNEVLGKDGQEIDKYLRRMDYNLKKLREALMEANVGRLGETENFIIETLRRQMYKINASKIINAISAKYLRVGQAKNYFEGFETQNDFKKMDAKTSEKISNNKYTFESASKESIKENIVTKISDYFSKSKYARLMKRFGLGKVIEESLKKITLQKEETKEETGKTEEQKVFDETIEKYTALTTAIIEKIEYNEGRKAIVLSPEEKTKIVNEVYKAIDEQIRAVKIEYAVAKAKLKGVSSETFDSVFMKRIEESYLAKFILSEDISGIIRGQTAIPKTRIDMRDPEIDSKGKKSGNPFKQAILNFMEENEPTLENVMKLKLQAFGIYKNADGFPVNLVTIKQFGEENVVGKWRDKMNEKFEENDDPILYEFFKGYSPTKTMTEAFKRYAENVLNLPDSLRKYYEKNPVETEKMTEITEKPEHDGTVSSDIIRLIRESDISHYIKHIFVYEDDVEHEGSFTKENGKNKIFKNKIKIIRLKILGGEEYDIYVPKENVKEVKILENEKENHKIISYEINGSEYMRVKIVGEQEDSLSYMNNILDALKKDFLDSKSLANERNFKFTPYILQKEIFRLFSKQRLIDGTNENITDFMYMDPNKTDYDKLLTSLMYRLNRDKKKSLSGPESKAFIDKLKEDGYFVDVTQSDPKVVLRGIKVKDEDGNEKYVSIRKIFAPLGAFTGRANRTSLSVNSRRNTIKIDNPDKSVVSSTYVKNNRELAKYEDVGFSVLTYAKDVYDEATGHSTHNETILVHEDYAREKFVINGEQVVGHGMKIIDRNASKHAIRIVTKDEWKRIFKGDEKGLKARAVVSKTTIRARELSNVEAEMSLGKDGSKQVFIDPEKLSVDYLKEQAGGNIDSDFGYLYWFLTDDLKDQARTAGDSNDREGAALSIEEFQMFDALREITYEENGERQVIDKKGELLDFFWKKSKENENELKEIIFESPSSLSGKKGKFRKEVIKRRMSNSAYAKSISNISLEADEIRIPRSIAESMQITNEKESWVLLHRSPTQGRRSFVLAKVTIAEDGDFLKNAFEISPALETALNLDYDGDGVSIFSLKGASDSVMDIAQKAFSHRYSKRNHYSDYDFVRKNKMPNLMDGENSFDIERSRDEILKPREMLEQNQKVLDDEEFDKVIFDQKVLKDYSGLFKNIFDADYQDYISKKENREWFNNSELKEKFGSIYGLITMAYDFYSQKTFDFSKHSTVGEYKAFQKIYLIIKKNPNESYKDHIEKLAAILEFDANRTKAKKSIIKSVENKRDEESIRIKEDAANTYLKELELFLNQYKSLTLKQNKKMEEELKDPQIKEEENVSGEVKDEERFKPNHEESDRKLLKEINRIFRKRGLMPLTKEMLEDYKLSEAYQIKGAFDQNEIKKFKTNDFQINFLKEKQIFDFLNKTFLNNAIKLRRKTRLPKEIMGPFYNSMLSMMRQSIAFMYKQDPSLLERIEFIREVEVNGKIVLQPIKFLSMIKIAKAKTDQNGATILEYKEAKKQDMNPAMTPKENIVMNKNIIKLEDPNLRGFYFKMNGEENPRFERLVQEFYRKTHNLIQKNLNDLGIGRSFGINPLMHNKVLYEEKVYESIYHAIISGERGKSILVDILRDIGDDENLKKLEELLKPFFMFQTVSDFVQGDKRTNFFKYVYSIKNIFNDEEEMTFERNNENKLFDDLQRLGLIETGTIRQDFIDDILTKLGSTDKKDFLGVINVFYHLNRDLKDEDTFHAMSQFKNMDQEFKVNYLVRLYQIKNGTFENDKEMNRFGFKKEDFYDRTENFEINKESLKEFYKIYDFVYNTISVNILIKNRNDIMKGLEEEKKNFHIIDNVIRNANYELSKHVSSTIRIQNTEGNGTDINAFPFRSALHPNNMEETVLVLKNANKNKINIQLTQRILKLIMVSFEKKGADTEMQKIIKAFADDLKSGNDIMALYLFEGKDISSFIDKLETLINRQSPNAIPITERILKYFLYMNKMQSAMGFLSKKIMPGTVESFYRDIKGSNMVDSEGNIKMNNIYRVMFFDFVYGEKTEIDNTNNTEAFRRASTDLEMFFLENPNMNTFGMKPDVFIATFFGKMLYEDRVIKQNELTKKPKKEIREELIEKYKARIEELTSLSELRDTTSANFLKEIEEASEKNQQMDLSEITKSEEEQNEIIEAFREFKAKEYLEEKDDDILDTYEWSRLIGANDFVFNKKTLFNIYAKMIGKKEFTNKEIKEMSDKFHDEIIRDNVNADFVFKGNKKIHTALIDAHMNLKVVELIIKEYEKNPAKYKGTQYETLIKDFSSLEKRKDFIVIDSENLVSSGDYNRIYEISYITFDESGKPEYHQEFLKYAIDEITKRWLKKKGYTENEIKKIEQQNKGLADFDYNEKIYEKVFAAIKGKKIIGQAVKESNDSPGDIDKLNYEYKKILRKKVLRVIKKYNAKEKEFLDNIETSKIENLTDEAIKQHLTSTQRINLFMKMIKENLKKEMREKLFGQGIDRMEDEHYAKYREKNLALMELFVKENNRDVIETRLKEILEIDYLPREMVDSVITRFQEKFEELKGPNDDGVILLQWPRFVENENGNIRIEYKDVETDLFDGDDSYKKIQYDPYDVASNYLFKSRAYYEVAKDIKDIIKIVGAPARRFGRETQRTLKYSEYEKFKLEIDSFEGPFDETILKVKKHLSDAEEFKNQGNEVEYLFYMNKAIKAHNKIHNTIDAFMDIDLATSNDSINAKITRQRRIGEGKVANVSIEKVDGMLSRMITDRYKEILASKREPRERAEDYAYISKMEDILSALEVEDFESMDYIRLGEILGLSDLDFANDIHGEIISVYDEYKRKGVPLYFGKEEEPYSRIPYEERLEAVFKKMAFYAVLYSRRESSRTKSDFLRMILKDEGVREYENYDRDVAKEEEIERITSPYTTKKVEDERNKLKFSNERIKVKNMILKEQWNELEDYLKDNPDKEINLENFKTRFYEALELQKQEGIKKLRVLWHPNEAGLPARFEEVVERVKYIEQKGIKGEFIKSIIYDFVEDINKMIYIKGYYMTNDPDIIVNEFLSYDYYNSNLTNYNGKRVQSDYRKEHQEDANIQKSYDYLSANVKKTENLSQYQKDFLDIIEAFRIKNAKPGEDQYDYERLYYEMTEGYLSKIYKLTIITETSSKKMNKYFSDTEKSTIDDAISRRNEAFQKKLPEKIQKLQNKIDELKRIGDEESLKEAEKLRLQIEDLKKVEFKRNVYYDEEKISKIRRSEPEWRSDEEIFDSMIFTDGEKVIDWMEKVKDTAHPTLKIFELSSKKQDAIKDLKRLVKANGEGNFFLGFTLLHDLIRTDEMSYSGYALPKPVAMLQSSIIRFQKFMMLMNTGFAVRNIYDGLMRNHQLILGTDDFILENYRFAKEARRSWSLLFKYKAYAAAHLRQVTELKKFFKSLKDFEEDGRYTLLDLEEKKTEFSLFLREKIGAIDDYLKNIINDERLTSEKRASKNYNDFAVISRSLKEIFEKMNSTNVENTEGFFKEFRNNLKSFFEIYQKAGFFKQAVMNNYDKKIKIDFSDNSKENIKKVKDEMNLVKFVNEIEKSGIISDQYEVTGKQEVKEIYKNIDKVLDDEINQGFLSEKIEKLMKVHPIAMFTNYIEQTQRIHGVLLDVFINGKTKDRALAESLGRFFNYGMKGAFEKSASVYFPFMSFAVRNLDFYLDLLGNQKYMRFMANVAQGMNTWYDDEEDENYRFSQSFLDFTGQQGWIPLGKDYGIKLGNAMFDAISLIEDPFESGYQKLNPILQQANNLSKGEPFNPKALASVTQYQRMASAIGTIAKKEGINMPQDLPDLLPSLFYRGYQFTPYKYRRYSTDYRNIYRSLFFTDGTRRTPSKNPLTTVKNIRYETFVRAKINAHRR